MCLPCTPSTSAACRWEMLQGTSMWGGALDLSVVTRGPWQGRRAVQIFHTELGKSSFVWDILFVEWESCVLPSRQAVGQL